MSEWSNAEDRYWDEVAQFIKPDILAEITKPPPPTLRERFIAWKNKPRGMAAIIAAQGDQMSNTIKLMQGR